MGTDINRDRERHGGARARHATENVQTTQQQQPRCFYFFFCGNVRSTRLCRLHLTTVLFAPVCLALVLPTTHRPLPAPSLTGIPPHPWSGAGSRVQREIEMGERPFRQERTDLCDQSTWRKAQAVELAVGFVCQLAWAWGMCSGTVAALHSSCRMAAGICARSNGRVLVPYSTAMGCSCEEM